MLWHGLLVDHTLASAASVGATASAACLVGACLEGLVGPLDPESGSVDGTRRALIDSIMSFALRAVPAKEPNDGSCND